MCPDAIWQAFKQTGDPLFYLLYKSSEQGGKDMKESGEQRKDSSAS